MILVEIVVFERGWVTLLSVDVRKLELMGYHWALFA